MGFNYHPFDFDILRNPGKIQSQFKSNDFQVIKVKHVKL